MKNSFYMTWRKTLLFLMTAFPLFLFAQQGKISGKVSNEDGPLVGATVYLVGANVGATTDAEGNYSFAADPGTYGLRIRYIGHAEKLQAVKVSANGSTTVDVTLLSDFAVDEVVVLGTRGSNRTNTDSPVPVDVINVESLISLAPQVTLNQIMHYAAPSFTSNTQTISDGTDHIDPASLRGLGPDQVLVLINGKRRHNSSLVNVNGTFGRGNVGTDLNAIPAMAIESIEVLRDGAAAQYGSDAIAGVINLRLKTDVNKLNFSVSSGANFTKNASPQKDVDGEIVEVGVNYGLPLGDKGGFINFTGNFNYRGYTNRMQSFSGQIFNGYNAVEWVAANQGADLSNLSMTDVQGFAQQVPHFPNDLKQSIADAPDLATLQSLLSGDVTDAELEARGQVRSDYNMRVGQSENRGGKFFANLSIPVGKDLEIYGFGGMSYRDGLSGCFYRLPHQSRTYTPTYINGFIPKINANIVDRSFAGGIRGTVKGWNTDFSTVYGSNSFIFKMKDTYNATLENASPLEFNSGGHSFQQATSNLDLSRYYGQVNGITGINIAFGAEYRFENYVVIPGSERSYGNYDVNGVLVNSVTPSENLVTDFFGRNRPSGAQCFAGFLPSNEIDATRSSIAGYFDTELDVTDNFLINAAVRFENYSDFGSTFNYKLASRLKVTNNFTLRAAHSTGFRAPSLQQINFSRTSTIFVTEGGQTVAQEVGVFSNSSRAAQLLGIPQLKQETSTNVSAGFTAKIPSMGIKLTVDAYLVNINDRVVLTGQFRPGTDAELISIFSQAQATRAAFFANAIDTKSSGLDIVATHTTLLGTKISLRNDLAATFSQTQQDGTIKASPLLKAKGLVGTYFDETSRIYLEEAVPRTKVTLSNTLSSNKLSVYFRNTYFGETTEATSTVDPTLDYTYSGKVVTDLSLAYNLTDDLVFTIGANNLLDVYPDKADPAFQSSGRFPYSRRSPQFSFGGRYLFGRINFTIQ